MTRYELFENMRKNETDSRCVSSRLILIQNERILIIREVRRGSASAFRPRRRLPPQRAYAEHSNPQPSKTVRPPRTRRKFLREILYKNIAIITIQHSKIYFVGTFGDFSNTVE